jgi:hypothetical protein
MLAAHLRRARRVRRAFPAARHRAARTHLRVRRAPRPEVHARRNGEHGGDRVTAHQRGPRRAGLGVRAVLEGAAAAAPDRDLDHELAAAEDLRGRASLEAVEWRGGLRETATSQLRTSLEARQLRGEGGSVRGSRCASRLRKTVEKVS